MAEPLFRADVARSCPAASIDWRVSPILQPSLRAERVRCLSAEADPNQILRVQIAPGDGLEAEPGARPTERVEVQVRRELVQFDKTTWYRFRFRAHAPWITTDNRTVIHQIKQNIAAGSETGRGGPCQSAHPFLKMEIRGDAAGGLFRVAKAGTQGCGDGRGQGVICGPWPITLDTWHTVHVRLKPSHAEGGSDLAVWLDGRPCPPFTGMLGYPDFGRRDGEGRPLIDAQPRFGIYRDAIDSRQTIDFADIAFWNNPPTHDMAWKGIEP